MSRQNPRANRRWHQRHFVQPCRDFDLACELGYGQFIWQSANYLNVGVTDGNPSPIATQTDNDGEDPPSFQKDGNRLGQKRRKDLEREETRSIETSFVESWRECQGWKDSRSAMTITLKSLYRLSPKRNTPALLGQLDWFCRIADFDRKLVWHCHKR